MNRSWLAAAVATTAFALSAQVASADATLRFPNEHAVCIAQAWVPFNTDPTVPAGSLGGFLSANPPREGELAQRDCH